jgi:2-polyprenyl-3-methyl-5-hydroxy-6-metoxy-1,4-benzoquinol methylase
MREARIDDDARCPCCSVRGNVRFLEAIPYRTIWGLLESEWDARFSPEVIRRHTPCEEARLFACGECGLEFFRPPRNGDERFYEELGRSPRYYSPWKWEFDWVGRRCFPSTSLLDVGCGTGDFLAGIRSGVRRAVGLERNPSAREIAASRGLEVAGASVEEYAAENEGSFDVVCAFHVIEHLPAPVSFLRDLLACLRPGGRLFLSMPNRLRTYRAPLEPLDCPPHHLTRWGPEPLRTLGDVIGAPMREIAFEPVELSMPWGDLREWIRTGAQRMPAGTFLGAWGARIVPRLVFFSPFLALYRRFRVLERRGYFGLSMAASFSRDGS